MNFARAHGLAPAFIATSMLLAASAAQAQQPGGAAAPQGGAAAGAAASGEAATTCVPPSVAARGAAAAPRAAAAPGGARGPGGPPGAADPGGQGRAGGVGGRGGGQGRGPVNTLGDGPWSYTTEQADFRVTVVTKGLDHPWGLAFLPNGEMLVTERIGCLRVIRNGQLDPTPIAGLPTVRIASIGGLMDIVAHPDFARNRFIYISYTKPQAEDPTVSTLAVARARWDGGAALSDVRDVFVAKDWYSGSMAGGNNRCCGQGPADGSYGARMIFGRDGMLYITSGDRNWGENSQNPSSHLGKILRVRDDGTIPPDNPFVGRAGYEPAIWTIGHRNPTGLTVHPATGEIWSTEFGPRGGDEVNRIVRGGNYGWILSTNGEHYQPTGVDQLAAAPADAIAPVLFWTAPSINPGNLAFYAGDAFPRWRGDLLMTSMSVNPDRTPRGLVRVEFGADGKPGAQEALLVDLNQRLRDVRVGPDGSIYVLTDETAGAILKIEPAP